MWGRKKTHILSARDSVGSFFNLEFYENVFDVGFDGFRCDREKLCYFLVGSTLSDQAKYFPLAGAEGLRKNLGRG